MLEYSKVILTKIAFDRRLFMKEYRKAIRYLNNGERDALKHWLRSHASIN